MLGFTYIPRVLVHRPSCVRREGSGDYCGIGKGIKGETRSGDEGHKDKKEVVIRRSIVTEKKGKKGTGVLEGLMFRSVEDMVGKRGE